MNNENLHVVMPNAYYTLETQNVSLEEKISRLQAMKGERSTTPPQKDILDKAIKRAQWELSEKMHAERLADLNKAYKGD